MKEMKKSGPRRGTKTNPTLQPVTGAAEMSTVVNPTQDSELSTMPQ